MGVKRGREKENVSFWPFSQSNKRELEHRGSQGPESPAPFKPCYHNTLVSPPSVSLRHALTRAPRHNSSSVCIQLINCGFLKSRWFSICMTVMTEEDYRYTLAVLVFLGSSLEELIDYKLPQTYSKWFLFSFCAQELVCSLLMNTETLTFGQFSSYECSHCTFTPGTHPITAWARRPLDVPVV